MNTSYDGTEIKQLISPSFLNCQAQCAIVNACVWFRFKRSDLAETCFLMSTKGAKSNDTDAVSGPPRCLTKDLKTTSVIPTLFTLKPNASINNSTNSNSVTPVTKPKNSDPVTSMIPPLPGPTVLFNLTALCMQAVAYDGITLPNVIVTSDYILKHWQECQQKCFETKLCTFFTYNTETTVCALTKDKAKDLKLISSPGEIYGPSTCVNITENCTKQNQTFLSKLKRAGVKEDFGTFDNVTSCQEACQNKAGCVWFMFSSNNRCQLLSAR